MSNAYKTRLPASYSPQPIEETSAPPAPPKAPGDAGYTGPDNNPVNIKSRRPGTPTSRKVRTIPKGR